MADEPLLPIKVVLRSDGDDQSKPPSPREYKPFVDVTDELRDRLVDEVSRVRTVFAPSFRRFPGVPAVAKVALREEALAKSHRPTSLFKRDTCPVIGSDHLGTLRVSVTPSGLDSLSRAIRTGTNDESLAHISAIGSIQPWTVEDTVRLGEDEDPDTPVRCELFFRPEAEANGAVREAFAAMLEELELDTPEAIRYTPRTQVFRFESLGLAEAMRLGNYVGIQSIEPFAEYRVVRTAARVIDSMSPDTLPPPETDKLTGLVGIIDTGTDPNNAQLQAWVEDRLNMVDPSEQDNTHGSFVAALIAHGRSLNGGRTGFPDVSSRIVDVVAFDRSGRVSEDELLLTIDEALQRFPQVKVWNLSLNREGECCSDNCFSSFAAALDHRAQQHGVLFVVAAGNYTKTFRPWPPAPKLDDDRISPPGDAAHALTVGSVAHLATETSVVRAGEPSPFSRRGPGAAYLLKPELSQPGGNCEADGRYVQTGVVSIDDSGNIAEDIGVSYATPLVSTLAGYTFEELAADPGGTPPHLVKALLMHSAFMRSHPLVRPLVDYAGCGSPGTADEVLRCRQSSATMVFQISLRSRVFLRHPFPMPACLLTKSGKLSAEVFMTLVHNTPIDENFGPEYCRSHVTAALGIATPSTSKNRPGAWNVERQVHPILGGLDEGYEKDLVEHGYKWSPIKLYYRKFSRGPGNARWGLRLQRFDRQEYGNPQREQHVAVVISVRDPKGVAPVYNEIVTSMNALGWSTHDLRLQSRPRLQN